MTPVDAERAFAADAKTIGQWTAFRKWSTDDAVMFVPQPTSAHEFLKDRKDPPKVIDWWPTASWISCDGSLAVNTGGWKRPDGSVGYFTTVWKRQINGNWKWTVDSGDDLKIARPKTDQVNSTPAACTGTIPKDVEDDVTVRNARLGFGQSDDKTLTWSWLVDNMTGERQLSVKLWDGRTNVEVLNDQTLTPPK